MRLRDSSGAFVGDSSATATPAWSNVVTPDEESCRRVRCAGSAELAPTYSEALLLLDDDDDTTVCAELPDAVSTAAPNATHITSPSAYPTATRATTRPNEVDDEDADEDDVFAVATLSSENPPSYEEALCFPVVEAVTEAAVATRFQIDVDSPGGQQMQPRCDPRLPNSRTFLSIETSL